MSKQSTKEMREYERFNVLLKAEIATGETRKPALVSGVSRKGCYAVIDIDQPFCPGAKCRVIFTRPCLEVHGEIFRVDEDGMAIKFTELLGNKTLELLTTASFHC